jgi:hypothetical protein
MSQNTPKSPTTLQQLGLSQWDLRFITAVAYSFLAVSLLCNLIFYSAFGIGGSTLLYAIIGLLFDLAKVIFIALFASLLRDVDRYYPYIVGCVIIWFALAVLSLLASIGFLSQINEQYEAARLKDSAIYRQREQAVENAQAKLEELADYAQLDNQAIAAQIASLRQENQTRFQTPAKNSAGQRTGRTVGQMTADCTKTNWYFNRYCGNVTDNKASLQRLQARLDSHQRYQSALEHYDNAEQAFNELTATETANKAHPLFINLGLLTNSTPATVKGIYILFTSLILELLASILMFVRHKLGQLSISAGYQVNELCNSALNAPKPMPLPMTTEHWSTTGWLSDPLLQQVKNDIAAGKLTRLSFRHLQRTYQISHNTANRIRQALLRERIAQMDATTHQMTLTGKMT